MIRKGESHYASKKVKQPTNGSMTSAFTLDSQIKTKLDLDLDLDLVYFH